MKVRKQKRRTNELAAHAALMGLWTDFVPVGYIKNRTQHFFPDGLVEVGRIEVFRFITTPA